MERFVTRAEIRDKLNAWRSGDISSHEIHKWANGLYPCAETDDREDSFGEDESIAMHVLQELDMLNMNLGLPEGTWIAPHAAASTKIA